MKRHNWLTTGYLWKRAGGLRWRRVSAALLAILLAYARALAEARGSAPLILLDEVAAHLDRARRQALFEAILETGAQAWLTGTDLEIFAELGDAARFVAVEEGRLRPLSSAP